MSPMAFVVKYEGKNPHKYVVINTTYI